MFCVLFCFSKHPTLHPLFNRELLPFPGALLSSTCPSLLILLQAGSLRPEPTPPLLLSPFQRDWRDHRYMYSHLFVSFRQRNEISESRSMTYFPFFPPFVQWILGVVRTSHCSLLLFPPPSASLSSGSSFRRSSSLPFRWLLCGKKPGFPEEAPLLYPGGLRVTFFPLAPCMPIILVST